MGAALVEKKIESRKYDMLREIEKGSQAVSTERLTCGNIWHILCARSQVAAKIICQTQSKSSKGIYIAVKTLVMRISIC